MERAARGSERAGRQVRAGSGCWRKSSTRLPLTAAREQLAWPGINSYAITSSQPSLPCPPPPPSPLPSSRRAPLTPSPSPDHPLSLLQALLPPSRVHGILSHSHAVSVPPSLLSSHLLSFPMTFPLSCLLSASPVTYSSQRGWLVVSMRFMSRKLRPKKKE